MVIYLCNRKLSRLVLILCLLLVSACAPKKPVYIPSEWQPPPPVQPSSPPPPSPAPAPKQTPILKPPPVIKESDIAAPAEAPVKAVEKTVEKSPAHPPPQRLASMHLVNQAKTSLTQGKPDPAIPLLEKAIQIDVHNGEAFFNLARAWRMKGSRQKALEFSKKAEILFQDDPAKLKQVYLLEADLYKELGDSAKTDAYRQKAAKLK